VAFRLSDVLASFHDVSRRSTTFGTGATPPGLPPSGGSGSVQHAAVYYSRARCLVNFADNVNHKYPLLRMPAWCRPISAKISSGLIGAIGGLGAGMASCHIGCTLAADWNLGEPDNLDSDAIAPSTLDLSVARFEFEVLSGAGGGSFGGYLFEFAQQAVAPRQGTMYDIVLETLGNPGSSGAIELGMLYTVGV
jgi:hypothetical protein